MKATLGLLLASAVALSSASAAMAQEQSADEAKTEELAKAAQNPIANMISVPFQFQSNFGVGPYHQPQGVLNIQPVIPIPINED
jgi:curli biogenesis system outer membrane secretion channel CsgG